MYAVCRDFLYHKHTLQQVCAQRGLQRGTVYSYLFKGFKGMGCARGAWRRFGTDALWKAMAQLLEHPVASGSLTELMLEINAQMRTSPEWFTDESRYNELRMVRYATLHVPS